MILLYPQKPLGKDLSRLPRDFHNWNIKFCAFLIWLFSCLFLWCFHKNSYSGKLSEKRRWRIPLFLSSQDVDLDFFRIYSWLSQGWFGTTQKPSVFSKSSYTWYFAYVAEKWQHTCLYTYFKYTPSWRGLSMDSVKVFKSLTDGSRTDKIPYST